MSHPATVRPLTRRRFLEISCKGGVATALAGTGFGVADVFLPEIVRRTIPVSGLAPAFSGLRVAHLSDLHHSRWIPASHLRRVVGITNSLQPDLVALTGDFIHAGREWMPGCAAALAELRAPLGVFAVLGNHDHYRNAAPAVREGLRRAGIHDLTNTRVWLRRGGEEFPVAGTGDYWREKQNLRTALDGVRLPGSALLLQHNPDYVERITDDRVGLVLSGHTHGGQIVLPFVGPPVLPSRYGQKYAAGLCQGPVAQVYVTRGVGSAFPPIRFCCPPEISLLTLLRA
jgi:uncharacterized protein